MCAKRALKAYACGRMRNLYFFSFLWAAVGFLSFGKLQECLITPKTSAARFRYSYDGLDTHARGIPRSPCVSACRVLEVRVGEVLQIIPSQIVKEAGSRVGQQLYCHFFSCSF